MDNNMNMEEGLPVIPPAQTKYWTHKFWSKVEEWGFKLYRMVSRFVSLTLKVFATIAKDVINGLLGKGKFLI